MPSAKPWLKYRRGNKYKITFPTVPSLTISPGEVDLYQEKMSHDLLVMKFTRTSPLYASLLKTGTPVIFSWSQGARQSSWTGYVNYVSNQSAGQQERVMKVVCVGASYLLKAKAGRIWRKKTVTDVARSIAKEFNLKFVGEPSKRSFDQISMTGQSYWQFLQTYAEKIGYMFTVQNTTMYMYPLEKFLNASTTDAPVLALEFPYYGANTKAYDRTLDSFTVLKGDYIESSETNYTTKSTSGVNPLTGKLLSSSARPGLGKSTRTSTPSPLFVEYSDEVVTNSSFSKKTAEDLALGANFSFPASARGQGDPRLAPYKAVYILGTAAATDGYWAVSKVHHSFNQTGLYEVELALVTDGVGATTETPFRKAPGFNQGTINIDSIILGQLAEETSSVKTSLISKTPRIKESDQGFNSTISYWEGT